MIVTDAMASATVEWAWPEAVSLAARAAGVTATHHEDYGRRFASAVVLTLAAHEGQISDEWLHDRLLWLATDVVPGLLVDLTEAREMAARMDADTLAHHLSTSMHFPGAPARVLRALVALRPELADVIRQRARALGHPDPTEHIIPAHVSIELQDDA